MVGEKVNTTKRVLKKLQCEQEKFPAWNFCCTKVFASVIKCIQQHMRMREQPSPLHCDTPHNFNIRTHTHTLLTLTGSLLRQRVTNSLKSLENGPWSSGGLLLGIRNRTLMGCRSAWGGSPWASSMAEMPKDQMSAWRGKKYTSCTRALNRQYFTDNT